MKAWQVTTNGEPADVMRLEDVEAPKPGDHQVAVEVRACALNFPDVLLCRGAYQIKPPLPFTPGIEVCGEVLDVGSGVKGFAPGDRVIGTPSLPSGGLADRTVIDGTDVFPAPDALDDAAASAMHIAYQTAWFGLHRRANLRSGQTLLVNAAAGGVGSAAVQLGKAAGARVVAVVGGADKVKVAEDLGADVVIDRREVELIPALKEATGRHGADVVFDPVGGEAYEASTKVVAFEGRILVIGFASGTIPSPMLSHALIKNYSIVGLHWGLYRQYDSVAIAKVHRELAAMAADGVVTPLVGGTIAMDEVPDGLTRLAAGDTVGRIVVTP
ncbi:MAG TPA: NADPH:quinone oxidoreductase family protein [Jiangellaceae bacterium]